jgi:hypothetical protein
MTTLVATLAWLTTHTLRAHGMPLVLEALALGLVCIVGWLPLALRGRP